MSVPARAASARTSQPPDRYDDAEVGAQHGFGQRAVARKKATTAHDAARNAPSQCPICSRSVQSCELVLHHTHSEDGQSRPRASADQHKFANYVPPAGWSEAASIRHAQRMGASGLLWVCNICNTNALPYLEPEATGGFGRIVLLMASQGQKLELLTVPNHPTLDGDEDTRFPRKQTHFENSAKMPYAFEDGLAPKKEDMSRYELVIDISNKQAQMFYKMPKEATRRALGPQAEMMSGLQLTQCPHLSSTHIELAMRNKRGFAWYRKVKEVEVEDFAVEEDVAIGIKSIKDVAPAPANPPRLTKAALAFNAGHQAPQSARFYSVQMESGEVKVVSDREIVGSGHDLEKPLLLSTGCRVLARGLLDFLHVNQDKVPNFSDTCGFCGTSHDCASDRRSHEYKCRFQPTPGEQKLRNSAAKAAGFEAGVHCDRGLGGTQRLQHVYPSCGSAKANITKRPAPVRLDEARFATEYLRRAKESPAAPSCVRLPAPAGVAQLLAAAEAVAASPSIPGAGSSSGASRAPTTQQPKGTKRTSSGGVDTARARTVARRASDPGPATTIATALAGGAAAQKAAAQPSAKAGRALVVAKARKELVLSALNTLFDSSVEEEVPKHALQQQLQSASPRFTDAELEAVLTELEEDNHIMYRDGAIHRI